MKIEVREDPRAALPLMESVLRGGRPLAPEYPLVFSPGGRGRAVVASEGGQPRSACAFLERELVLPAGRARVGLIGSVSTAADARGRGLASAVLERAEAELRERGCLLALLWADSQEFYSGRGYAPVGAELDVVLNSELLTALPAEPVPRAADERDFADMHELYATQELRVLRTRSESELLYASPGMRILVAEGSRGVEAYACLGRGEDLRGVVHEWAGSTPGVLACLRSFLELAAAAGASEPLYLMGPVRSGPIPSELERLGAPSAVGFLGMGKLLDVELAGQALRESAERELGIEARADGGCTLVSESGRAELSREGLISMLLPSRGDRAWLRAVEAKLGLRFRGLPWNAFLWGLDSI